MIYHNVKNMLPIQPRVAMSMLIKPFLLTVVIGLLLAQATQAIATRTDVNVVAPWEISSTDPATDGFIFLRMGVMETLVSTDEYGELVPGLASAWAVTDGGLTWTFKLQEASFHDGTLLTPDAVVYALNRAVKQPGPVSKAPIDTITKQGDSVQFKLTSPYAILPAVLSHSSAIVPSPSSFDAGGKSIAAIGTGPFKVDTLTPPQALSTTRFEAYWGEAAKLASAKYIATKRAETRSLMAESGDADIVFTLDPSGFKSLSSVDELDVQAVAIPRVMLLKVNTTHPMLGLEARLALSLAIDRQGIAAGIMRFPNSSATQLFPPALTQWHEESFDPLSYDPEAAKATLASLGWAKGDDGILVKDGERLSLTLRTFPDRPELPLVGAALQDQWREIGVELKVSVSNYSEIPAGHQDGSLELALFARNYGATADPTGNVLSDFGASGGDWGAMNWKAPEVADAIDEIAATDQTDKRNPLIQKVVSSIHNDLPVIPVVWYQHTVSVANKLDGLVIDPLERSYGLDSITWSE